MLRLNDGWLPVVQRKLQAHAIHIKLLEIICLLTHLVQLVNSSRNVHGHNRRPGNQTDADHTASRSSR